MGFEHVEVDDLVSFGVLEGGEDGVGGFDVFVFAEPGAINPGHDLLHIRLLGFHSNSLRLKILL